MDQGLSGNLRPRLLELSSAFQGRVSGIATHRDALGCQTYANHGFCSLPNNVLITAFAFFGGVQNRDLLAGAPTGSGKTLAFLLPIIHHLRAPAKEGFRAAVVSPTRELAIQIHDQLRRLSEGRKFRICVLTKASESTMKQDPALRKKFGECSRCAPAHIFTFILRERLTNRVAHRLCFRYSNYHPIEACARN